MAGEEVLTVILASAAVLVVGVFACIFCCCCCCAPAICTLCSRTSKDHCCSHSNYQLVGRDADHHQPTEASVFALSTEDVPIAEAYVVPPLVSSRSGQVAAEAASGGFRDVWAALLFAVNLVAVISLASQAVWPQDDGLSHPSESKYALRVMAAFVVTVATLSGLLASSILYFVVTHASNVITYMLYWNIFSLAIVSLLSLLTFQILACVVFAVLAMLNYCYYVSVQDRIPFASAVLAAACAALRPKLLALLTTAAAGLGTQIAWLLLWSSAAYTLQQRWKHDTKNEQDDELTAGFVLLLFSLYWTSQVIQYVVSVTASGTVACWYFQPAHPAPVKGSLFRALTYSFGSVCIGAMLVAIMRVLRQVVEYLQRREARSRRRNGENLAAACLLAMLHCLVRCVEDAVVYLNRYALAYVAAYGLDFVTSGKHAYQLFERRGWSAIVNDNLVSYVFALVGIGLAVLGAVLGAVTLPLLAVWQANSHYSFSEDELWQLFAVGSAGGAGIAIIVAAAVVNMLDSAVAMIFVCFAEDPGTLQALHCAEFESLLTAWQRFHPESVAWCSSPASSRNAVATEAYLRDVEMAQLHPYQSAPRPSSHGSHGVSSNPPPFNPNYSGYK